MDKETSRKVEGNPNHPEKQQDVDISGCVTSLKLFEKDIDQFAINYNDDTGFSAYAIFSYRNDPKVNLEHAKLETLELFAFEDSARKAIEEYKKEEPAVKYVIYKAKAFLEEEILETEI